MGCGTSKLNREEEMPAGLRPFRARIEDMKHRRRVRNVSIMSSTELLKSEERDDASEPETKKKVAIESEDEKGKGVVVVEEVKKEEEEGRKVERRVDEDLPGSPSFRVYFTDLTPMADSDDDSKIIQMIKNEKLDMAKEGTISNDQVNKGIHVRGPSHESLSSTTSNEGSISKPQRKDRGRRFRALTKAPSQVYSFLTVRNRNSSNTTGHSQDTSQLMTGKATKDAQHL